MVASSRPEVLHLIMEIFTLGINLLLVWWKQRHRRYLVASTLATRVAAVLEPLNLSGTKEDLMLSFGNLLAVYPARKQQLII